jgi:DNA invertase Pin-like site-specific DNA recombinase
VRFTLHDIAKTPLDPTDAAQSLHFHVLAAIGQFEKDRFAERRTVGIAKAKKEGKYKGRAPTARAKTADVLALHARSFKAPEIATQLGIGVASVYRILADHKKSEAA